MTAWLAGCGQQLALLAAQCSALAWCGVQAAVIPVSVPVQGVPRWSPPAPFPNTQAVVAGKKVHFRKPAPGATDAVPSRKRATPINLASAIRKSGVSGASGVSQRPFRDRVLHLLALRPYRKAELLLRLQKDGLAQADKDSLDGLLQQVGTRAGAAQPARPAAMLHSGFLSWRPMGLSGKGLLGLLAITPDLGAVPAVWGLTGSCRASAGQHMCCCRD